MTILIAANFVKIKILLKNIIYAKHAVIKYYAKIALKPMIKKMKFLNLKLIRLVKSIIINMRHIVQNVEKINAHIVL